MTVLDDIKTLVPHDDILLTRESQAYASHDQATNVAPQWPLAVVRVNNGRELDDVVMTCLRHGTPIVMRGAGSGKSGGAVGDKQSIVIDVTRLNRILLIDKENLIAEVEPGVVLKDLQDAVEQHGLFYPPDPASSAMCTIGGNVAENAAGPSTLKYGTTRDYLLGGRAIIGTGEVIEFGKRTVKGVAGYDIAALLCGSEGSLAVFTKLILRLLPLPRSLASAMIYFADDVAALAAVNSVLNSGYRPKTLEFVDELCLKALAHHQGFTLTAMQRAALIIECDASGYDAQRELDDIAMHLTQLGATIIEHALNEKARDELWRRRSSLSEACTKYRGYKLSEDIAVPLGALASFATQARELAKNSDVEIAFFGHAGDGNLHVQIVYDDPASEPYAQTLRHQILLLVIAMRGTITAEHGIGVQKKAYLPLEQSRALVALQRRIKAAFDPHHLLNPGKIFD